MIHFSSGASNSVCLSLLLVSLFLVCGILHDTESIDGHGILLPEQISGSKDIVDNSVPGSLQIPYSGLIIRTLTPSLAERLGLDATTRGALITSIIPGTPAENLGLRPMNLSRQGSVDEIIASRGDIIQAVDGSTAFMLEYQSIEQYISDKKRVGENITLSILRDGQVKNIELILESKPTFLWYEHTKEGIRIKYPSDWHVAEEEDFNSELVVLFYSTETAPLTKLPVADVSVSKYASNFSDSSYNFDTDLGSDIEIFRILDFNITRLDNSSAYFSVFYDYSQKNNIRKIMTVFTEWDSKLYTINFSTLPDKYDDYLPLIKEIIESFQFT